MKPTDEANPEKDTDEGLAVTRRGFCNGLILTSAALIVASSQETSAVTPKPAPFSYPPTKIEGAEAMAPGSFLLFAYPKRNDAAILVRTYDGKYYAHGQKCSHLGCSVNFNREHNSLECPCHMGAYDLRSGSVLQGPPRRSLDHIFLELRGGAVWAVGRTNDSDSFVNIAS
jgi:Rieske Fe-S protein